MEWLACMPQFKMSQDCPCHEIVQLLIQVIRSRDVQLADWPETFTKPVAPVVAWIISVCVSARPDMKDNILSISRLQQEFGHGRLPKECAIADDRNFQKTFQDWLIKCHNTLDKRIRFRDMASADIQVGKQLRLS